MKKILFVSGVGRSGTSALVNVLNAHPALLVGQERYFNLFKAQSITPQHFEMERFLDFKTGDSHERSRGFRAPSNNLKYKYSQAIYVGDKYPSLFRNFQYVFETFPEATHVYIIRNPLSVIQSYDVRYQNPKDMWKLGSEDGMDAWNESVGKVAQLKQKQLQNFIIIQYEEFYKSVANINDMFLKMGLNALADTALQVFVDKFQSLNDKLVPRRDDLRAYVAHYADWKSYKVVCSMAKKLGEVI